MFTASEIGINPTVCVSSGKNGGGGGGGNQIINHNFQTINNLFTQIASGVGAVLRFKLTSELTQGGHANASIQRYDGTGFSRVSDGLVFDEEPGGFWSGDVDAEGWCTARDGKEGEYSIIYMPQQSSSAEQFGYVYSYSFGQTIPGAAAADIAMNTAVGDTDSLIYFDTDKKIVTFSKAGWYFSAYNFIDVRGTGYSPLSLTPSSGCNIRIFPEVLSGPTIDGAGSHSAGALSYNGAYLNLVSSALLRVEAGARIKLRISHGGDFTSLTIGGGGWNIHSVRFN